MGWFLYDNGLCDERVNNVCILNPSLKNYSNEKFLNILLYGSEDFKCNMNKEKLKATIKFLKISERFNGPPFLTILKNFSHNGTYFSYICTELTLSST